jgi:hypothetical protein
MPESMSIQIERRLFHMPSVMLTPSDVDAGEERRAWCFKWGSCRRVYAHIVMRSMTYFTSPEAAS